MVILGSLEDENAEREEGSREPANELREGNMDSIYGKLGQQQRCPKDKPQLLRPQSCENPG